MLPQLRGAGQACHAQHVMTGRLLPGRVQPSCSQSTPSPALAAYPLPGWYCFVLCHAAAAIPAADGVALVAFH
jgi:hypothetical protein